MGGGNNDKAIKEILQIFQEVKKAADRASALSGGADESRCLDALKQLKDFPVTSQILVSTMIGKQLRPLTKHPRDRIRVSASELIGIWKKLYTGEPVKKNGNDIDQSPKPAKLGTLKIHATHGTASVKAVKTQKSEAFLVKKCSTTESVQVEMADQDTLLNATLRSDTFTVVKRDANVEKFSVEKDVEATEKDVKSCTLKKKPVDEIVTQAKLGVVAKCHDDLRDKVRESLFASLSKVAREVSEEYKDEVKKCDPGLIAVNVESAMFEKWGRTNESQRAKYRSVMFNINDSKNPDFRRKVLLGHIPVEKIPNMTAEDMASDERKSQNDEIKRKALLECEREAAPKSTTDQFKCGKCGHRETTYYQMQTRSADEPMTTFVTCVNCNNHWKFC